MGLSLSADRRTDRERQRIGQQTLQARLPLSVLLKIGGTSQAIAQPPDSQIEYPSCVTWRLQRLQVPANNGCWPFVPGNGLASLLPHCFFPCMRKVDNRQISDRSGGPKSQLSVKSQASLISK